MQQAQPQPQASTAANTAPVTPAQDFQAKGKPALRVVGEAQFTQTEAMDTIMGSSRPVIVITAKGAQSWLGMIDHVRGALPGVPVIVDAGETRSNQQEAYKTFNQRAACERADAYMKDADVVIVLGPEPESVRMHGGNPKCVVLSEKTVCDAENPHRYGVNLGPLSIAFAGPEPESRFAERRAIWGAWAQMAR